MAPFVGGRRQCILLQFRCESRIFNYTISVGVTSNPSACLQLSAPNRPLPPKVRIVPDLDLHPYPNHKRTNSNTTQ